jgi:WD40 repeat protein
VPFSLRLSAKTPLDERALGDSFAGRPEYTSDGNTIRYSNPDTGAAFSLVRLPDGTGLTLLIDVPAPPFFGLEAAGEVGALAAALDLEAADHAAEEEGSGFSESAMIREYARANAAAHSGLIEAGSDFLELPTGVLLAAWRWNRQRAALAASLEGAVDVPRVEIASHPTTGQACTFAVLATDGPVLVPAVDLLASGAGDTAPRIATTELEDVLGAVGIKSSHFRYRLEDGLREAGIAHYDLTKHEGVADAMRAAMRQEAEPLRRAPMATVVARELARLAMGIGGPKRPEPTDDAARFPRECRGFLRTRRFELARVLGGYTWLSPWKLEAIAFAEQRGVVAGVGAGGVVFFAKESGKRLREVRGDIYAGTSIAVSDDAKTLAIGSEVGTLDVFDVELEGTAKALQKRATYSAGEGTDAAASHVLGVSPDGLVVIGSVGDDIVVLRDGEEPTTFRANGAVCASRDLLRVFTGTAILDVTTERDIVDLPIDPRTPRVPALSPDGCYLAFATTKGELTVIRSDDAAILAVLPRKEPVRFIAFTPDGTRLIVGDATGVEFRKAPSLELEKSFATPTWDAAVTNTAIYRVVDDRIWTQPLDEPAPPVNDGPINQLFHSARGPIALATSTPGDGNTGGRAILWFLPAGSVLRATERLCPDRVNLTRDGRYLCLATEAFLKVFDVSTLAEVLVVEPLGNERYVRPIDLDASPDDEHVLACLEDGWARMVSFKSGLDIWRAELGIRCATFTPDGRAIVAGDSSRLRVIDAATGIVEKQIAIEDPRRDAEHVLLDAQRAVRVAVDVGITVVDLAAETYEIFPFATARDAVAASPDGHFVAVLVDGDGGIDLALWSVEAKEEVDRISLRSAEDEPVSAAFSPDGKTLLVGTSRGALLVFSARAAGSS